MFQQVEFTRCPTPATGFRGEVVLHCLWEVHRFKLTISRLCGSRRKPISARRWLRLNVKDDEMLGAQRLPYTSLRGKPIQNILSSAILLRLYFIGQYSKLPIMYDARQTPNMAAPSQNPRSPQPLQSWPCPLCNGSGVVSGVPCRMCQGSGKHPGQQAQ
jgi:hypothetical protein